MTADVTLAVLDFPRKADNMLQLLARFDPAATDFYDINAAEEGVANDSSKVLGTLQIQ